MYCGKCGKDIPEGSQFCPECGEKIGTTVKQNSAGISTDGIKEILSKATGRAASGDGAIAVGTLLKNKTLILNIVLTATLVLGLILEGSGVLKVTTFLSGYFGDAGTLKYGLLDLFDLPILNTILAVLYIVGIIISIVPLITKKPLGRLLSNTAVLAPTLAMLAIILEVIAENQNGLYKLSVTAKGWFLIILSAVSVISSTMMRMEAKKAKKAQQ